MRWATHNSLLIMCWVRSKIQIQRGHPLFFGWRGGVISSLSGQVMVGCILRTWGLKRKVVIFSSVILNTTPADDSCKFM